MLVRYHLTGRHGELYERTLETPRPPQQGKPLGLMEYGVPPSILAQLVYDPQDGKPHICRLVIDDASLLKQIVRIGGWKTLCVAA